LRREDDSAIQSEVHIMRLLKAVAVGALTLSAGAFAVADATAGGGSHASQFAGEHSLAALVQKLELTAAQRESIRAILDASKTQRQSLREQHREVTQASASTLPDDPNYTALVEKRKQLASEAIQQRSELNAQVYAVLTPEQKAQVPQLIKDAKANMKQRRHARRARGEAQL
jgi:periplasmic protein CpxP/Spy